jgi:hypothetical protein
LLVIIDFNGLHSTIFGVGDVELHD